MENEEKQAVEEMAIAPSKMEFRLISPTENGFLKHIEWNKEELLEAVRSKIASYEGIVYVIRQIKRCLFRQIKTGLSEHLTMG